MSKRKKILIAARVEYTQTIKGTLKVLEYENLTVCKADYHDINDEITEAFAKDKPFDLLIIDEKLSHGLGLGLLKNFRNRHHNNTPIIIVFEHEPDLLNNLLVVQLRFAACLNPPFSINRLKAAIKAVTPHNA